MNKNLRFVVVVAVLLAIVVFLCLYQMHIQQLAKQNQLLQPVSDYAKVATAATIVQVHQQNEQKLIEVQQAIEEQEQFSNRTKIGFKAPEPNIEQKS